MAAFQRHGKGLSLIHISYTPCLRGALDVLMRHRTTLVIAHRLATIRDADLILVLDNGTLAEAGTHDQLLRKQGVYAKLASHQGARDLTAGSATSLPT